MRILSIFVNCITPILRLASEVGSSRVPAHLVIDIYISISIDISFDIDIHIYIYIYIYIDGRF